MRESGKKITTMKNFFLISEQNKKHKHKILKKSGKPRSDELEFNLLHGSSDHTTLLICPTLKYIFSKCNIRDFNMLHYQ